MYLYKNPDLSTILLLYTAANLYTIYTIQIQKNTTLHIKDKTTDNCYKLTSFQNLIIICVTTLFLLPNIT